MTLHKLASCEGGNCPEAFVTDGGDVVIKGRLLGDAVRAQIQFSAGEEAVVIPASLLRQAVHELGSA